jgi:hypothetical protein
MGKDREGRGRGEAVAAEGGAIKSEGDLGPVHHGLAVEELQHRRLDRGRLLMPQHRRRHDGVAAVVEPNR